MIQVRLFPGLLRYFVPAAFGLVVTACDDTTGPPDVTGIYVLETTGGAPLPAVYLQYSGNGTNYTWMIHADTLTFFSDGRGLMGGARYVVLTERDGSTEETVNSHSRYGISYEVRDGKIFFQPDAPVFQLQSSPLVGSNRWRIAPPSEPSFLSYIQRYFEATIGDSVLVVDEVTRDYFDPPLQVYRRVF